VAIDPKDIGELQKALNDAAGKASVLWTSFIILQLYLVIAFGSVTHRDLFLENSIKLPVLNVDLPLVGFFVVVPIILVVFHFYIFLQLLALAAKAKRYDALLKQEAPASDRLREQLDSFVAANRLRRLLAAFYWVGDACRGASNHPDSGTAYILALSLGMGCLAATLHAPHRPCGD
jgi:hypothetical protein